MIICKCDGCGKEVPAASNGKEFFRPEGWMEKTNYPKVFTDEPLYLHACSMACIDTIELNLSKARSAREINFKHKPEP